MVESGDPNLFEGSVPFLTHNRGEIETCMMESYGQ